MLQVWRTSRGFAQKFADDFAVKSADNGGDVPTQRRVGYLPQRPPARTPYEIIQAHRPGIGRIASAVDGGAGAGPHHRRGGTDDRRRIRLRPADEERRRTGGGGAKPPPRG